MHLTFTLLPNLFCQTQVTVIYSPHMYKSLTLPHTSLLYPAFMCSTSTTIQPLFFSSLTTTTTTPTTTITPTTPTITPSTTPFLAQHQRGCSSTNRQQPILLHINLFFLLLSPPPSPLPQPPQPLHFLFLHITLLFLFLQPQLQPQGFFLLYICINPFFLYSPTATTTTSTTLFLSLYNWFFSH